MPLELLTLYMKLPVFMMVCARLAGLVMFQPILGAMAIPMRVRVLLVIAMSALVTPFVHFAGVLPDTPLGLAIALGGELLLGSLVGLVVAICFVGVQMGGTLIAQESGLAFGRIADPSTGESMAVLSAVYVQLTGVVYLIVGGHRAVLAVCLDTFETIPLLGETGLAKAGAEMLVDALTVGGMVAIRVAAPAVLTLFLVNMALGFISRTVPQLNIVTIGFSLKALIGFVIMAISLPSAMMAFTDALELSLGWLSQLTGG